MKQNLKLPQTYHTKDFLMNKHDSKLVKSHKSKDGFSLISASLIKGRSDINMQKPEFNAYMKQK